MLYAVPTGDQIARFWHEVVLSLAEPLENGVFKKYESDKIVERTGTEQRIRAKTAWNADTLRGDTADLLILDEFQLMNEDAWGIVGLPMLMDNNGDAVLIYTPPSLHTRSVSKATDKRHAAKMFKECQQDPTWLCLHWTSYDNPFILREGIEEVSGDMTALAVRQEIMAEDIDEVPGALWKQSLFDDYRVAEAPQLVRLVIGVDPSGGSMTEVGIVAAGLGTDGHGYILRDESMLATTPKQWAARITWLYNELKVDRVVGETNYGGDMVETTIKMFDDNMSYRNVTASRGKLVRAEPICAMYEKGYVHHVGESKQFELLESECCSYVPGDKHSPNRMDACLIRGTKIFTGRGWIPIERVEVDDRALTRDGMRRVVRSERTQVNAPVLRIAFSDGRELCGTAYHPVWVERRGFTPIDELVCGDIVQTCESRIPLNWMELPIEETKTRRVFGRDSIIRRLADRARKCFTVKSGKNITAQFLKAITSITGIAKSGTTIRRTFNAYLQKVTAQNIAENAAQESAAILIASGHSLPVGMAVRRAASGTELSGGLVGAKERSGAWGNAGPVGRISLDSLTGKDSALERVFVDSQIAGTDTRSLSSALRAEALSGRASIETGRQLAPVSVLGVCDAGKADVFNLEVAHANEYFANGILVHNCVWAMTELFPENARLALVEQAMEEQSVRKVQTSQLIKPATNPKTDACSFCGKNSIVRRGPIKHCTNCGKEEGAPSAKSDYERQSRNDLLK